MSQIANEFGSLPMETLIGAPLVAACSAQRDLGDQLVGFVNRLAYGTENPEAGDLEKGVLTLPMRVERPVLHDDGVVTTNSVDVAPPVLSLVPIPALLIETVDINFSMEIHTVDTSKSSHSASIEATASGSWWGCKYSVTGKASTQRENTRSTDKTAKYEVNVKARQQEQTEGMAKLLNLMSSAVEPIDVRNAEAAA